MTMRGVILGTAAYMSPEQAKGRAVDKRADIWAFGCVLFEMLTGQRAFPGDDLAETLAAVIKEQPDVDATPVAARKLLRRCFEKDPRRRLRDLGDVWDLLGPAAVPGGPAPASSRRWLAIASLAVAAAIAAGSLLVAYRVTRPTERPLVHLVDRLEAGLSLEGAVGSAVAISPDGSRVAYVTIDDARLTHLSMRNLGDAKSTPLSNTDEADGPFFSPDGRWIGFFTPTEMKKVSVDGGAAVVICALPGGFRGGGYWAEDGSILFAGPSTPVLRVSSTGGTPVPITTLEGTAGVASHRAAELLPGGAAILFAASPDRQTWENATIEVQRLESGQRRTLVQGGYHGRYVPGADRTNGHLVYMHGDTLFAAPMSVARLELTGAPVPTVQDVARREGNGIAHVAVASSGTLVYVSGAQQGRSLLHWQNAGGEVDVLGAPPARAYLNPRLSPDGSRIAVVTDTSSGVLSLFELAQNRLATIVKGVWANRGAAYAFTWAPDGRHLAAQLVDGPRGPGIYWVRADGAGEPALLVAGAFLYPSSISADGTHLVVKRQGLSSVALDLADPDHPKAQAPREFLDTKLPVAEAVFSPDGRWVAYSSAESGVPPEIVVRPFPGPGGKWQVSTGGGIQPRWSAQGRELFYLRGRTVMAVSYTAHGDVFAAEQPRVWSRAPLRSPAPNPPDFDLTSDGKRIVAVASATGDQPPGVTFLFNFADELRRKAPGK